MNKPQYTLGEIANILKGKVIGDESVTVNSLSTLENAQENDISFLSNPKYLHLLKSTKAAAVLLIEQAVPLCPTNSIVLSEPYLAFAKVAGLFDRSPKRQPGIHLTASICDTTKVSPKAHVGHNVVIGSHCVIEDGVTIEANTVISDFCILRKNVLIKSNVSIYHDVIIDENTIIHANSVIGSDGFGNAKGKDGEWLKIPQLGGVRIGKNVEIGASTTVDRGTIDDTILEDGVKLDNQIQIAHNVIVGKNTAMAAQVGVAGSTTIGKNCLLAGQVGVNGHISICDNVIVGAKSPVIKPITEPGAYQSTIPVKAHMQWKRTLARIGNLDKLAAKVKKLSDKLN